MAVILGDKHYAREEKQKLINAWIDYLGDWFPDLDHRTYFVPPLHVNTIKLKKITVPAEPNSEDCDRNHLHESHTEVFALQPPLISDTRDDRAHLSVLHSLWNFSKQRSPQEVMVVLSRYQVGNYMTKNFKGENLRNGRNKYRKHEIYPSDYFPVPTVDGDASIRRGDFDILIVHKLRGFIVIEVKAIGDLNERDDVQSCLSRKLDRGLFQLDKLEDTLKYMISDMSDDGRARAAITKTLALPNMSRVVLSKVMHNSCNDEQVQQMQTCLGVSSLDEAIEMCLCKEEVTNILEMSKWWRRVRHGEALTPLEDHDYKELIARFCGPVSTVKVWSPWHRKDKAREVRTISEATHEMEMRYTMRILRSKQLELLNLEERLVYLTGPPRSGKTLVLLLKAMQWAEEGDTLIVVRATGNNPGHFISHVLYNQILKTLEYHGMPFTNVHLETVDACTDPQKFVDSMIKNYQKPETKLRFLIDELWVVDLTAKLSPLITEIDRSLDDAVCFLHNVSVDKVSFNESKTVLRTIGDVAKRTVTTIRSINLAHRVAKKLLKERVHSLIDEFIIELGRIQTADDDIEAILKSPDDNDGTRKTDHHILERVLEILRDTQFYADVILSWLASPILKEITKIVADNQSGTSLWCTGFWPRICPDNYHMEEFKICIGCPPHVQRIMEKTETLASHHNEMMYSYVTNSTAVTPPLPAEGELYHLLNHDCHMESEESVTEIYDCEYCGNDLADLLLNTLNVGKSELLQYRDVMIVGRALLPIKPESAFLKTLTQQGIPVSVVVHGTEDLGPDINVNHVIVTNTYHGHGLERAIVVFVPVVSKCSPYESARCRLSVELPADASVSSVKRLSISKTGNAEIQRTLSSSYSVSKALQVEKEEWMMRLGDYNQRGLWFVASRSAAELIIFHV